MGNANRSSLSAGPISQHRCDGGSDTEARSRDRGSSESFADLLLSAAALQT
jgi:hypothetical protein